MCLAFALGTSTTLNGVSQLGTKLEIALNQLFYDLLLESRIDGNQRNTRTLLTPTMRADRCSRPLCHSSFRPTDPRHDNCRRRRPDHYARTCARRVLLNLEKTKGSPLTESEVTIARDNAACIAMPRSAHAAVVASRGYADIDPEHVWEEWLRSGHQPVKTMPNIRLESTRVAHPTRQAMRLCSRLSRGVRTKDAEVALLLAL